MNLDYETILRKIIDVSGQSRDAIEAKVQAKIKQLSDLVSREGAAHIVANELGVKVYEISNTPQRYKINTLKPGLRSVEVLGKIVQKYEVRTFKRNDKEGKVASMLIGDDTGMVRLAVWDENIITNTCMNANDNDVILIGNAYVKENNGFKELHLGSMGSLSLNPPGETVTVKERGSAPQAANYETKALSALQANDAARISGTIVQLFEPRFYPSCPSCNKKVVNGVCTSHGTVQYTYTPILNFVLDDGSENMRVVCFRDTVQSVLGIPADQLELIRQNPALFQTYKTTLLGKQLTLTGKASRNEMFDRIEFTANTADALNTNQILQGLL